MTEQERNQLTAQARLAAQELLDAARLAPGEVFVVGCSSSEVVGGRIGHDSSMEAAAALYDGIAPVLAGRGVFLAAQCCEHLNRALILERAAAARYGWEEVCVVPHPHAGGSWATTCGGTLIGMHLRPVAVPVRLSLDHIGQAILLCARTRPKLIGGERAQYTEEDL